MRDQKYTTAAGGDHAARDAERVGREHERGEHHQVLDRVGMRLLQAFGPGRERLRVGGIARRYR
jgi:hypothetical protein